MSEVNEPQALRLPVLEVPELEDDVDVTACVLGTCACDVPDAEELSESAAFWDELVDELGDPTAAVVETDYAALRAKALAEIST